MLVYSVLNAGSRDATGCTHKTETKTSNKYTMASQFNPRMQKPWVTPDPGHRFNTHIFLIRLQNTCLGLSRRYYLKLPEVVFIIKYVLPNFLRRPKNTKNNILHQQTT